MIVTFTANPSLDRTAPVEGAVTRGGVHRLGAAVRPEPGLGGDHHPLQVPAFEGSAQSRFGFSTRIGGAGVEERDAMVQRRMHQLHGLALVKRLLTPPTRAAEPDL